MNSSQKFNRGNLKFKEKITFTFLIHLGEKIINSPGQNPPPLPRTPKFNNFLGETFTYVKMPESNFLDNKKFYKEKCVITFACLRNKK